MSVGLPVVFAFAFAFACLLCKCTLVCNWVCHGPLEWYISCVCGSVVGSGKLSGGGLPTWYGGSNEGLEAANGC